MSHTGPPRNKKSLLNPGMRAAMYGALVLLFLVLTDQLSIYYGLAESQRIVDDSCGAVIAGLLIYRLEYNRAKYLTEKLKTIEMMNHHVRNALQVIVDSVYLHGHTEQLAEIQNSVKRIDWALREILPGRSLDEYNDPSSQKTGDRTAA
jgi:hypothetical protein